MLLGEIYSMYKRPNQAHKAGHPAAKQGLIPSFAGKNKKNKLRPCERTGGLPTLARVVWVFISQTIQSNLHVHLECFARSRHDRRNSEDVGTANSSLGFPEAQGTANCRDYVFHHMCRNMYHIDPCCDSTSVFGVGSVRIVDPRLDGKHSQLAHRRTICAIRASTRQGA